MLKSRFTTPITPKLPRNVTSVLLHHCTMCFIQSFSRLKGVLMFMVSEISYWRYKIYHSIYHIFMCRMLFDKKMYQVLSSYFPCITRLSRTRIPLVCKVLIGSNGDLLLYKQRWPNITQVCNQKSENEHNIFHVLWITYSFSKYKTQLILTCYSYN